MRADYRYDLQSNHFRQQCITDTTRTGAGAREKRTTLLSDKLSEKVKGPFLELFNTVKGAAQKTVQQHAKDFVNEVQGTFAEFNSTFMRAFKADQADTPEAKQLRETLRARVPAWRRVLDEDIDRCLIACTDYANSG